MPTSSSTRQKDRSKAAPVHRIAPRPAETVFTPTAEQRATAAVHAATVRPDQFVDLNQLAIPVRRVVPIDELLPKLDIGDLLNPYPYKTPVAFVEYLVHCCRCIAPNFWKPSWDEDATPADVIFYCQSFIESVNGKKITDNHTLHVLTGRTHGPFNSKTPYKFDAMITIGDPEPQACFPEIGWLVHFRRTDRKLHDIIMHGVAYFCSYFGITNFHYMLSWMHDQHAGFLDDRSYEAAEELKEQVASGDVNFDDAMEVGPNDWQVEKDEIDAELTELNEGVPSRYSKWLQKPLKRETILRKIRAYRRWDTVQKKKVLVLLKLIDEAVTNGKHDWLPRKKEDHYNSDGMHPYEYLRLDWAGPGLEKLQEVYLEHIDMEMQSGEMPQPLSEIQMPLADLDIKKLSKVKVDPTPLRVYKIMEHMCFLFNNNQFIDTYDDNNKRKKRLRAKATARRLRETTRRR